MLTLEEGTGLIRTARAAIEFQISGKRTEPESGPYPRLRKPKGVFVSILDNSRGRRLRGCIGNPFPDKPLLHQTAQSAWEAATKDPRYRPIRHEDLPRILIEVTVLSKPTPMEATKPMEIPNQVIIGRHGLIVDGRGSRGLLLPQVAVDERFDTWEFLSQCCMKAGLLPDAWLDGSARVSRFEGQIFSEEKLKGRVFERVLPRTRANV